MHWIATVDRQRDAEEVAVWVTSNTPGDRAMNVNAVVMNVDDPDTTQKFVSLTQDRILLLTDGSSLEGLPFEGDPIGAGDLERLLDEVSDHQAAILAAIADYRRRTKSKSLVDPKFTSRPSRDLFVPSDDTPSGRALALANFAKAIWTAWLQTDLERIKRTVQPKTGLTPWIMPAEASDQATSDFPPEFNATLAAKALV